MKKTTVKISWDNLQALKKLSAEESLKRNESITPDGMIRIMLEEKESRDKSRRWLKAMKGE